MMDRLLCNLLHGAIVSLITICIVVSLMFLYSALIELIGGRLPSAGIFAALCLFGAVALAQLWRHKNDLIYY